MFILLMALLIVSSVLVLITKRNRESFFILGMCLSLATLLSGIMVYIAKKGGISDKLQHFFYFNAEIKTYFQYLFITLGDLGFIVAAGKFLFPLCLLLLSMHYSIIPWLHRSRWVKICCFLPPSVSLLLYYPNIYDLFPGNPKMLGVILDVWIVCFIVASIVFLVYEAYSIQIVFIRRQFILIISFVLSLTFLYSLYFGQDPGQIYHFYTSGNSIYYLKSILSLPVYTVIVTLNIALAVVGFAGLMKYTKEIFESNKEEVVIQRKFNSISTGTSVFVHSIKNQLLANRVIYKRLNQKIASNVTLDEVKEYSDQLSDQNERMLARIEELYRSVKADSIHLAPVLIESIIENVLGKFNEKYPYKQVNVHLDEDSMVLADQTHLCEAIYNLLINAQEAVDSLEQEMRQPVLLRCFHTRQYTVIEVKDAGIGINKKELKKIFDPFYSSKNSNHNWGMGLHYVRTIVQEHFGILRYESEKGKGTTFLVLLPKLKR